MAIEWKIISELTDKTVLGTDGLSHEKPRKKSRAILINKDGKIAVIYEKKSNLHTFPGGSFEPGEDELSALVREISEETGCTCDTIIPLGIVSENRNHANSTHLSYFFVVHTQTLFPMPHFTTEEIELETTLKWCSLDETLHFIKNTEHDTSQKRFMQARDLAALHEYICSFQPEYI